jgi:hypothetical protein
LGTLESASNTFAPTAGRAGNEYAEGGWLNVSKIDDEAERAKRADSRAILVPR